MSETSTVVSSATGTDRSVDVFDASGAATATTVLPGHLFDVTANIPLIHQVVVAHPAPARQGTAKVKTRAGPAKEKAPAGGRGRATKAAPPEGHRPRPPGFDPRPAVCRWWHRPRSE